MPRIRRTRRAIPAHLGLAGIAQMRQPPKLKRRSILD
jgi:hypothetical protein